MINNLNLISDKEVAEELQSEIIDGEKILWAGRPKQGLIIKKSDIFNIPFSVLWCSFLVFICIHEVQGQAKLFFVPGLILTVIILYALFGRFYFDANKRKNLTYGITKTRIFIKSVRLTESFKTEYISDLSQIEIIERKDGSGTIILGANEFKFYMLPGMYRWQGSYQPPPRLEYINDAREVYNLLLSLNPEITGSEGKYVWG